MALARTAIITALLAAAVPSAAKTLHADRWAGTMTVQLAPRDSNMRRPTVCTEQYAPVCGRLNGVVKTYPNECYARAAGAEVIAPGPCTGGVAPRDRR